MVKNNFLGKIISKDLSDKIKKKGRISLNGIDEYSLVLFSLALIELEKEPLIVALNEDSGELLYRELKVTLGSRVGIMSKRDILPFEVVGYNRENEFARVRVLKKIYMGEIDILIVSGEVILEKFIRKEEYYKLFLKVFVAKKIDIHDLEKKLVEIGYTKVLKIDGRGEFSLRGDILDVFLPSMENIIRFDFFDRIIESIREVSIEDGYILRELSEIIIEPTSDLSMSLGKKNNLIEKLRDENFDFSSDIRTVEELGLNEKYRRFFPGIFDSFNNIGDYFENGGNIVYFREDQFSLKVGEYLEERNLSIDRGLKRGLTAKLQKEEYFTDDRFLKDERFGKIFLDTFFGLESIQIKSENILEEGVSHIEYIKDLLSRKVDIYIFFDDDVKKEKLINLFMEEKFNFDRILFVKGSIKKNFTVKNLGVILSLDNFFHRKKSSPRIKKRKFDIFLDLGENDYCVHEKYGICQYLGIESKSVLGIRRDYINLRFRDRGKLFLPVDQIEKIEKYVGGEGAKVTLSLLGSKEWEKAKEKVRISANTIARELLEVYTKRKMAKGFSFSKDTSYQEEFENSFPYEETPDQISAIIDLKKDMESDLPMDRLIIGDVGYGKTEVAMRGMFKAVMDGKQVGLLSPTTILSNQHFDTLKRRFTGFPVKIELLNRFVKLKERKRILEDIASGEVDIIVGTHRILSKDVVYDDLGLLVIDEEQKFGVKDKEKMKSIKENIDYLSLSATPIPRTLHMSLVGARDHSIIETPPKERLPINTYVLPQDDLVIKDAILREINRGGQVFYLYNRVEFMRSKVKYLEKLLPDVNFAMVHGQMSEGELEGAFVDFYRGDIDVLVCSTIIENGINIKNANTLIVEDADKFGLSQIYQIKGRVGRGSLQAYGYFMFKKNKVLNEHAIKRLKALKENTELGAGFKIAMEDLDIRGAGQILGKEQHGHIVSIGFELYCKILDEEMIKIESKGEKPLENLEVEVELPFEGYIPDTYILEPSEKIKAYKKFSKILEKGEIDKYQLKLEEKFGRLPKPVENLIKVTKIKALAREIGIDKIYKDGEQIYLRGYYKRKNLERSFRKLKDKFSREILFDMTNKDFFYIIYRGENPSLARILEILMDF